jgi:hypothetical protein
MNNGTSKILLIGDNPFHGISHFSQERARNRPGNNGSLDEYADIVLTAIENGGCGFMCSVSETTLSIIKKIRERKQIDALQLFPIVPYAFEYVRIATQTGTPGLAARFAKQIAVSGDVRATLSGFKGVMQMNPTDLLKTYLSYEISRIKSAAGSKKNITSIFLHEVITDMCIALNMKWLLVNYFEFLSEKKLVPGFHTRNFPLLLKKFDEWGMDPKKMLITTPFNKAGFQMNPSRKACEEALASLSDPVVLAISVFAGGYFKPPEAFDYIASLDNIKGIVAGVSTKQQAIETPMKFVDRFKLANS